MQDIEKQVRSIMGKVLGIEEIDIPANATRDNFPLWDSLKHMNFLLALEDEFEIEFTDEEIAGIAGLVEVTVSIEEKTS
jgi:acyl carrier protein